jgi:hypothetical protein
MATRAIQTQEITGVTTVHTWTITPKNGGFEVIPQSRVAEKQSYFFTGIGTCQLQTFLSSFCNL